MERAAADYWYNAFANPRGEIAGEASEARGPANLLPVRLVEAYPEPESVPEVEKDLPALVRFQSGELERLAHENHRLMDRIESFLQLQHREQVLRQQLQNQVDRLCENLDRPAAPALNRAAIRAEAREGVAEELKPVLLGCRLASARRM